MRKTICNRTYRNAIGNDQARVNVMGTDVLRTQLAVAFFDARHVVRHASGVPACLAAKLSQSKQAPASAARSLELISSSMPEAQRWLAGREAPRAFVTSG